MHHIWGPVSLRRLYSPKASVGKLAYVVYGRHDARLLVEESLDLPVSQTLATLCKWSCVTQGNVRPQLIRVKGRSDWTACVLVSLSLRSACMSLAGVCERRNVGFLVYGKG